ncbi:MAG TPA: hypothetical protein O0X39_08090, partial [Methanocorpusculum sp.]|nr:hypothetical protein [Methanocorpusculum sp.]
MKHNVLVLGAAVLVLIGCIIAAGCVSQDSAYQPARVYDLEHHYYLPAFLDYLGTRTEYPYFDSTGVKFEENAILPLVSGVSLNSDKSDYIEEVTDLGEVRLAIMDNAGITCGIVSSAQGIEIVPKEEAVKYAKLTNDAVAEAVKKYPGRFLGTITL